MSEIVSRPRQLLGHVLPVGSQLLPAAALVVPAPAGSPWWGPLAAGALLLLCSCLHPVLQTALQHHLTLTLGRMALERTTQGSLPEVATVILATRPAPGGPAVDRSADAQGRPSAGEQDAPRDEAGENPGNVEGHTGAGAERREDLDD